MDTPLPACPYHFPFQRQSAIKHPAEYARLRDHEPVAKVVFPTGDTGYVVTRYEHARMVLSDPRFSRAQTIAPGAPRMSAMDFPAGSLFTLDPPQHTRLRQLVANEFTPRRVDAMLPHIQSVTDRLLDAMDQPSRHADINPALAFPLPVIIICELLGVPLEEREHFRRWADASVTLTADPTEAVRRQKEMFAYFGGLVERKRASGGDDLLSALIAAHDEQGALSQMELVIMAISLLVAGFETTGSVLGTGVMTLLRHPEQLQSLLAAPERIDSVVEELLRLNPIGDGGPVRIATEDVDIGGFVVPMGSLVVASVSSGNMDERNFEDPDGFHGDRFSNRHLAFGHGVHHCLGASLARAELRIAILSLFQRFPSLRLAVPVEDLKMKSGLLFHRLETLPVQW